jgi:hypothetical protein
LDGFGRRAILRKVAKSGICVGGLHVCGARLDGDGQAEFLGRRSVFFKGAKVGEDERRITGFCGLERKDLKTGSARAVGGGTLRFGREQFEIDRGVRVAPAITSGGIGDQLDGKEITRIEPKVGIVVRFVEEKSFCIGHKKKQREQQDAK